ncbi:MAG TPA: GH25 family lysozyme [bacterium]|jgi:lysozyme|nr:GH25 family lysozyme [bacterium]
MAAIQLGAQGPPVLAIQNALIAGGYLAGPVDGLFGPITQAALIAFQKSKKLAPDGILGPDTKAALFPLSGDITAFPRGIDVSHYQGTVNWAQVSAAGFSFVYAKTTESSQSVDPSFQQNWSALKNGPLLRGAYHYFDTAAPAASQADFFCKTLGALAATDLPPMLDFEAAGQDSLTPAQRAGAALAWMQSVASSLGRKPILYTNSDFFEDGAGDSLLLAGYEIWMAQYPADGPQTRYAASTPPPSVPVRLPSAWTQWNFWQYTGQGVIPGAFNGENLVDFDVFQGSLKALAGL